MKREFVYGISTLSGKCVLGEEAIETAGPKRITLMGRPYWNDCRQIIDRANACFTPEDAVVRFVAERQAEIEQHERAIETAKRLIESARGLISKKGVEP